MEWVTFEKIVQYFFEFGPFAILAFILVFALPRLYKKIENAKGDLKQILKRHIVIYHVVLALLILFCVGYWLYQILPATKYYYGEILHLNPAEYKVESRHLHLKSYSVDSDYVVDWIWKKRKDDKCASIKLIGKDPASRREIKKELEFYPGQLKRNERCTFTYSEEDGTLLHNKTPLTMARVQNSPSPGKKVIHGASPGMLYAQPPGSGGLDTGKTLNLLQAIDTVIRDQAVERVIRSHGTEKPAVIRLLAQGFTMLQPGTPKSFKQRYRLYNRTYLFTSLMNIIEGLAPKWRFGYNEWKKSLGDKTVDLIVEEAGSSDPDLHTPALEFLAKFRDAAAADLEEKLNREPYREKGKYRKGVSHFFSRMSVRGDRREHFRKLLDQPAFSTGTPLSESFVKPLSESVPFVKPTENISSKNEAVIAAALELKEKNISFKWGGKSPGKGFDSSGFMAYIFDKAGLLEKPEDWWSGKFRERMGKPVADKVPREIGDLVFYKGGYVMFYLGDNKIIGMTVNGIIIQDYREFPSELLRVNRVDYGKNYGK